MGRKERDVLEVVLCKGHDTVVAMLDAEVHQRKIHCSSAERYTLDMDVI